MSKNYGMTLGASVRGYYDGRNMRMDAEDRDRDREDYDEDRKRTKRLQGQYDPMDLETAMLRLQDAKRTGELNEYIHKKGYGKRAADEGAKTSTLNYESAERRGKLETAAQPGAMKGAGYADQAAANANELGQKAHPINMQQTDFTGKQLTDQEGDYDQGRDFWGNYENVQRSLANFSMTGNPKILMDAYDMYIDDGIDAVITKNEEGGYTVAVNNGQQPAQFESKEQLLQATEKIFMDHMQRTQPVRGGQQGQGQGYGINAGMMGGGQSYKDYPSDVKTAEYLIQAMQGIQKYAQLSPEQMRMEAFRLANAKVDDTPESDIRQFFVETFMQQMKGPPGGLGRPPDPTEAWKIATEMTENYRYEQHGIGQKPKIKTGGGEEGENTALEDWVNAKAGIK